MEEIEKRIPIHDRIDMCQCKAEVLKETFDGLEKKARNSEFSLGSGFFAGVTVIAGELAKELDDIANEII